MPKKPLGIFAKAHLESERLFTELQAEAMLYLKEQFSMEDDSFKLEGATWEEFFKRRDKAIQEGTLDQFDQELLAQMGPLMEQLRAQQA